MKPFEIVQTNRAAWSAIHLALVIAAHALKNGQSDLASVAHIALDALTNVGYRGQPDETRSRFTGESIAKWQDMLYAVNELPGWCFSDDVLVVGWLIECGGPSMGRGPASAAYETNVRLYVGGTRNRYNTSTQGHDRKEAPVSHAYSAPEGYSVVGTR